MNRVRDHLKDIEEIEAAMNSQGLSNWAISRAHDLAKEEMEKLTVLEKVILCLVHHPLLISINCLAL